MKIEHIRKAKDFRNIFKNGKKVQGKIFSLHLMKDADSSTVTRNYIRRLIFATLQKKGGLLRNNAKAVVRLTRDIRDIKKKPLSKEVRGDLEGLLKKAGTTR